MNPAQWSLVQWLNFVAFALALAAGWGGWVDYFSATTVSTIHEGLVYAVALINFMLGRPAAAEPVATQAPLPASNTTPTTTAK